MERIKRAFERKDRAAFIPFLNVGDPDYDTSLALFRSAIRAGADIIELGTPYSDPLADGPVIQASALRSLNNGFQLPESFRLASTLRSESDVALVLFTYVNPLYQYTPEAFFRDAAAAGVDGVIVPDLPYEESGPIRDVADRNGIALIPLVAPTSGPERIRDISDSARGFVYCVSSLGVTGERAKMSTRLRELVDTVRTHSDLPVAVGFGISTPEQAQTISEFADGVIVGSALIRRLEQNLNNTPKDVSILSESVYDYAKAMIDAMSRRPARA